MKEHRLTDRSLVLTATLVAVGVVGCGGDGGGGVRSAASAAPSGSASAAPVDTSATTSSAVAWRSVERGDDAAVFADGQPGLQVREVADAAALHLLYEEVRGGPVRVSDVPAVDFAREEVVALFLDDGAAGEVGVEVVDAVERPDALELRYAVTRDAAGVAPPGVPFHVLAVPSGAPPVALREVAGAAPPPGAGLAVTTRELRFARELAWGEQALAASGGTAPLVWRHVGGALPAGLAFAADADGARVEGVAEQLGRFAITVEVQDAAGGRATGVVEVVVDEPVLTVVAGTGQAGFAGDGGPATASLLESPRGLAVAPDGDLVFVDGANYRLRRVDAATGTIETIAGAGARGFAGDGGPAAAARLDVMRDVEVAADGDVFFVDAGNQRVRRIDAQTGVVATVAGDGRTGTPPDGALATQAPLGGPRELALLDADTLLVMTSGSVYALDLPTGRISRRAGADGPGRSPSGAPALATRFALLEGLAVDPQGGLVLAEFSQVRVVDGATGVVRTAAGGATGFAGDGGPATSAAFRYAVDVAVDPAGNAFVADSFNQRVRRIDAATRVIDTVAGTGVEASAPAGTPARQAALAHPRAVVLDGRGGLLVAEQNGDRIVRIGPPSP